MKFGHVVFELCERTDRQTNKQINRHTHHNTSYPSGGGGRIKILTPMLRLHHRPQAIPSRFRRCNMHVMQKTRCHTARPRNRRFSGQNARHGPQRNCWTTIARRRPIGDTVTVRGCRQRVGRFGGVIYPRSGLERDGGQEGVGAEKL